MARAYRFAPGQGVVPNVFGRAPAQSGMDGLDATEILAHYERKGLRGDDLVNALDQHERILRATDPDVAECIRRTMKRRNQRRVA